jgi:AraC-like DNA-binding protein
MNAAAPQHEPECLALGHFRRQEGFERWRELTRPVFSVDPLLDLSGFHAGGRMIRLGGLVLSDVRFGAQRFDHDPRRQREYNQRFLLLELYHAGEGRGLAGECPTLIQPGRIHLVDLSRPYLTLTTEVRSWGLLIPHAAVGYDPGQHGPYYWLLSDAPNGLTLTTAFRCLYRALRRPDPMCLGTAALDVLSLIRALFLDASEAASSHLVADIKGRCIQSYIEDHLGEADLVSDRLCRAFNCSRATLYRHFKDIGGVDRYVRSRRLHRCYEALRDAPSTRGQVKQTAERWGFENQSHFHRLFLREFGLRPGDWLERSSSQGPDGTDRPTAPANQLERLLYAAIASQDETDVQ